MNNELDIDRFVKDPSLLVELCREVIDQLDASLEDVTVAEHEAQLRVIAKAVEQLEKTGVPAPESLRAEKIRLAVLLAVHADGKQALVQLADEFQNLLMDLQEKLGRDEKLTGAKRRRSRRSKSPKTDNTTLREQIVVALKKFGGRAKVAELLDEIEGQLEGKLLPGDLELRQDGKTLAWRNNAQWERLRMVHDGTLRNDSPNGTWELSENTR